VQFAPHLKRAKPLRIFCSDFENVCGFSKKIEAKYEEKRLFGDKKLKTTLRLYLINKNWSMYYYYVYETRE